MIAAVILAAGASTRMGRPKQLLELGGETLVHRAARMALEAGFEAVLAVLGCDAEAVRMALASLPVRQVVNEGWAEGMASSIRAGIGALPDECSAVVVLACDQPVADAAFLRQMIDAHRREPDRVIASAYAAVLGIPALFPRRCFPSLLALAGDRGARALLAEPATRSLPLPGGELDLDTPQDLEAMRRGTDPA